MKLSLACLSLSCILLTIVAGSSTTLAQGAFTPPTIIRPVFNSTQTGFDSGWVGNMQVTIRKNSTTSRFKFCLWRDPPQASYFCRFFNQSEGASEGSDRIRFVLQVPATEQGHINVVSVQTCNNNDQCGNSVRERFLVLPTAPTIYGPAHPSPLPANRTVTFSWQHSMLTIPGGPSPFPGDYQLTILTAAPEDIGWTSFNPEAVSPPNQSIRLNTGSNCAFTPGQSNLNRRCHTLSLPAGPTAFIWAIANCAIYPEKGRRCGLGSSFRTLNASATAPVTFNANLAATFRHPRCVNCHAVVQDGFANDPQTGGNGGLPAGHPQANATMNGQFQQNGQGCRFCHTDALLPLQGTDNPGWHGPGGLDFRNRNDLQLCLSAQFGAGGVPGTNAVLRHLTQDKLILWGIGDGRVPGGGTRPLAPPGNIATWQSLVQSWVAAGMPCS